MSPELALVDPALAEREQIATRLDAWLARTEWRPPTTPSPTWTGRRTVLAAALLASMLVNGLLTSFLLFGHHSGPTRQPAAPPSPAPATIASVAAQVFDIPPPKPSQLPRTTSK